MLFSEFSETPLGFLLLGVKEVIFGSSNHSTFNIFFNICDWHRWSREFAVARLPRLRVSKRTMELF
jgi:hypothetical protein